MSEQWSHQLRLYLSAEAAAQARDPAAMGPITDILHRHDASMKSQLDAFSEYVAAAERQGVETFPLYRWTRRTLDDPTKVARHARAFAIHVGGEPVYPRPVADALEAALAPLVEAGVIERLSRHDTNPDNNLPIPAEL